MTTGSGINLPGTRRDERRRFNMVDLAILIVAVATVCGVLRAARIIDVVFLTGVVGGEARMDEITARYIFLRACLQVLTVGLLAASGAVVVLRLRLPRPRRRRLMRQPGWVACLAASGVAALAVPVLVAKRALAYGFDDEGFASWFVDVGDGAFARLVLVCGAAVAASWLILALGGAWADERSWVDRLGRAVGVGWLLTLAADVGVEAVCLSF